MSVVFLVLAKIVLLTGSNFCSFNLLLVVFHQSNSNQPFGGEQAILCRLAWVDFSSKFLRDFEHLEHRVHQVVRQKSLAVRKALVCVRQVLLRKVTQRHNKVLVKHHGPVASA